MFSNQPNKRGEARRAGVPHPRPHAQAKVGALLVNCAAEQFILRARCAGSKGCAPACHDVNPLPARTGRSLSFCAAVATLPLPSPLLLTLNCQLLTLPFSTFSLRPPS